jgi:lipopolysaccharide/colanic/teichoic acid biosynthesis glycosyltransferase
LFKIKEDPRVTRVGGILRRAHLDELPQLINVIRGEMSLVGPRPLVSDEDAQVLGTDRTRLRLTPGITGPWQVRGPLSTPLDDMAKLDYKYVSNWSLWEDVEILAQTAARVVSRSGH